MNRAGNYQFWMARIYGRASIASCDTFVCNSDDATGCEIAKINWKSYCALNQDNEQAQLGLKAVNGELDNTIQTQLTPTNINVANPIKTDSWLSGQCWADQTYDVMGRSFKIPFSQLCTVMQWMGAIVVAFSFVAAAKIIGVL